jgi:hypothetical protein
VGEPEDADTFKGYKPQIAGIDGVRRHLARYYDNHGDTPPWEAP